MLIAQYSKTFPLDFLILSDLDKSNDPVKYYIISECTNMVFNYNKPWIEAGNNVRSGKKLQAIFACMKIQSKDWPGFICTLHTLKNCNKVKWQSQVSPLLCLVNYRHNETLLTQYMH